MMPISNSLPDTVLKPGVTISTNRPANPYQGQVIYETDTALNMQWTGTQWLQLPYPQKGRNLFDNGQFQINQRQAVPETGFSFASSTTGYIMDRWHFSQNVTGLTATSVYGGYRVAGADNTTTRNHFIYQSGSNAKPGLAAGDHMIFNQRFEGRRLAHLGWGSANPRPVTFTMEVSSPYTGTFIAELHVINSNYMISRAVNVVTGFNRVSVTFPGCPSVITDDSSLQMHFNLWMAAGTTYNSGTLNTTWVGNPSPGTRAAGATNFFDVASRQINILGMQLEEGFGSTPIERVPYDEELRRCYRHAYFPMYGQASGNQVIGHGSASAATQVWIHINLPVTMRAAPSYLANGATAADFLINDNSGNYQGTGIATDAGLNGFNIAGLSVTVGSGLTANRWYQMRRFTNVVNFGLSAEL